ncbi:unnamed protein product, partial [Symbiodinium necroappetens]
MALRRLWTLALVGLAAEQNCEGEGECRWTQVSEWISEEAYMLNLNKEIAELYAGIEKELTLQDNQSYAPRTLEMCRSGRTKGCVKPSSLRRLLREAEQPVIIKGLAEGWPKNGSWSKESVLQAHGAVGVTVSLGSLYPAEGGFPKRRVKVDLKDLVQRFLPDSRFVAFDKVTKALLRRALGTEPQQLLDRMEEDIVPVLSAGGPRSGIPWHTHAESYLLCSVGTKRWFTFPPGTTGAKQRGHPFLGSLNWTRVVLPSLLPEERPISFVQHPGDFVYLPAAWPHLTLNLDDSLCLGWQNWLENKDVHQLIKGCSAAAPSDPDACTLLGEICNDGYCPFSRQQAEFFDDALRASPLHLAAAGHAAQFDQSRVEELAVLLVEQEEELLQDPLVDNLTLAYGWIFLAQSLYNTGGDKDMADAFLTRVGRLVKNEDLAMEALALYDKTNGTKSFDYANDFNESNATVERREKREKQKTKRGK